MRLTNQNYRLPQDIKRTLATISNPQARADYKQVMIKAHIESLKQPVRVKADKDE